MVNCVYIHTQYTQKHRRARAATTLFTNSGPHSPTQFPVPYVLYSIIQLTICMNVYGFAVVMKTMSYIQQHTHTTKHHRGNDGSGVDQRYPGRVVDRVAPHQACGYRIVSCVAFPSYFTNIVYVYYCDVARESCARMQMQKIPGALWASPRASREIYACVRVRPLTDCPSGWVRSMRTRAAQRHDRHKWWCDAALDPQMGCACVSVRVCACVA